MKGQEKNELKSNKMPKGIPYIVGNEAAERFSYYGMKVILFVFMTEYIRNSAGELETFTDVEARQWVHLFGTGVYFFPIIGALLADIWWGKFRTIIVLSVLYCLGHIALAINETETGLLLGLTMIAVGSGGIKPCVSAHVGDQFTSTNKHLIERVFSYFYIAINVGAAISQIFVPILLREVGPWLAFGLPGGLMILATIVFWLGRNIFISIPPVGWKQYKKTVFSKEGIGVIKKLVPVYLFISVFWSLFDQTGSTFVEQGSSELVNKQISWLGVTLYPDQVQAANPIMVLILVPIFSFYIYPWMSTKMKLTPLKKVNIGMYIASLSFLVLVYIQYRIDSGVETSIIWQLLSYFLLTVAEVMVSITALEFSYTQAPLAMKSFIMGLYLLSVSLGNFITALFNTFIKDEAGNSILSNLEYFTFFTLLMFVTGLLFIFIQKSYKERTYIHEDGEDQALVLE